MSDDWSLSGKEWNENIPNLTLMYTKKDIETLRVKLVEDLLKWARESDKFDVGEVIEPVRIVQKRFGNE